MDDEERVALAEKAFEDWRASLIAGLCSPDREELDRALALEDRDREIRFGSQWVVDD